MRNPKRIFTFAVIPAFGLGMLFLQGCDNDTEPESHDSGEYHNVNDTDEEVQPQREDSSRYVQVKEAPPQQDPDRNYKQGGEKAETTSHATEKSDSTSR